ncbi:molybdenum cofactor biosynthesis protein MoaE [Corynebacterium glucuronolyticum]|uniref:Molybdenum cofactor biosynthesis protein MoaE n=2 Tax=Corynebacterium glucuronolyticum TaxID=39791 RepID=A0A7T4EEP0_9CORY|nr:molybdenum cofactor biosynthesis protein MoaE [Corynebacterium glucuronolyticum]QQU87600.1 molybdenum cofactor biosynthesis protein MoaE [Corynebacterium glucuronolyticum]
MGINTTPTILTRMIYSRIRDTAIDVPFLAEQVACDEAGAIATFDGRVRNHDHGHAVTKLTYSAHPAAERIIAEVAEQIGKKYDLHSIAVEHRTGDLSIGDTALGAAVSSSHRREAFEALAELVDEIKAQLPIWKQQFFSDGTYEWSNCA